MRDEMIDRLVDRSIQSSKIGKNKASQRETNTKCSLSIVRAVRFADGAWQEEGDQSSRHACIGFLMRKYVQSLFNML